MRVLVPLAEGFEEMEAVIIMDVLRRAGWHVVAAALADEPLVTGARGTRLVADALLSTLSVRDFDMIVLPGGAEGSRRLAASGMVLDMVRGFDEAGKWVAAMCAAPQVLYAAGLLQGRAYTCYPGIEAAFTGCQRSTGRVVQDGTMITSQGPGTAFEFALHLLEQAEGKAKVVQLAAQMLYKREDESES